MSAYSSLPQENISMRRLRQSSDFGEERPRDNHNERTGKLGAEAALELRRPADSGLSIALSIFLCLVALLFIVLAVGALMVKGRRTDDLTATRLEEAMRLGATFYPMVFAALMSRALKSIGRYRAERGIALTSLWSLMNCKSVFDPVLLMKSLPASILTWGLVALWALSPLGSQASLRLMNPVDLPGTSIQSIRYMDTGPAGHLLAYYLISVSYDGAIWPTIRDLYAVSLLQTVEIKESPRDQWGNVKIPLFTALHPFQMDDDGWIPVLNLSRVESYSSLVGIPVVGLPASDHGPAEFSLETVQVSLSCPSVESVEMEDRQNGYGLSVGCLDCDLNPSGPRSDAFLGPPMPGLNATQQADRLLTKPRTIQFNSTTSDRQRVAQSSCQVTQHPVETMVRCENTTCAATKIRASTTDRRNPNYTNFDLSTDEFEILLDDISAGMSGFASSSQLFLNDSTTLLQSFGAVDISSVPPSLFAQRASILLNTVTAFRLSPNGFRGTLPTNLSAYGPAHIPAKGMVAMANASSWGHDGGPLYPEYSPLNTPPALSGIRTPFVGASTNATILTHTNVYQPSYPWITVLLISSGLLLVAGLVGLGFTFRTLAPNIFDPVISLTYDNPYLPIASDQDSILEAEAGAKQLGGTIVRLGNVPGNEGSVQKVRLGIARDVQPLQQGKPYI